MVNELVNAERWGSDLDLETCTSKSPFIRPPRANCMRQVSLCPEHPRGGSMAVVPRTVGMQPRRTVV